MNSDIIKSIFSTYLKSDNPQYAILINGPWGCGKTFFWKNTLYSLTDKNGFKPIYISLNGISKIDHLEQQIYLKVLPITGINENKYLQKTIQFISNIANGAYKFIAKSDLKDLFKGIDLDFIDFSKYVFCFDDLERCQIPVKEVLGYINNFVEHRNLKVVLFADEPKIDPIHKGYDAIKEKIIGISINFELDIRSTFPELIKKHQNDTEFHGFLHKYSDFIIEILEEYNQKNLRIISFYISILEPLFLSLNLHNDKITKEVLLFANIICSEFKTVKLISTDYTDFKKLDKVTTHLFEFRVSKNLNEGNDSESKNKNEVDPYLEYFGNTYLLNKSLDYFFYPSIYSYILSGYIDLENFNKDLKNREPQCLSIEVEALNRLVTHKFRELTNEDFDRYTKIVLACAKNGTYSIYDYLYIGSFFYFFIDNNLIHTSNEEINNLIITGIDLAKQKEQVDEYRFENLTHFKDYSMKLPEIFIKFENAHRELAEKGYKIEGRKFVESILRAEDSTFFEYLKDKRFDENLIPFIESNLLFDVIISLENKKLYRFIKFIEERYRPDGIHNYLSADFAVLNKLKNLVMTSINKKSDKQPQIFLLKTLNNSLEHICSRLEMSQEVRD